MPGPKGLPTFNPFHANRSHNGFLEVLLEGGAIAAVLLAAFLIWSACSPMVTPPHDPSETRKGSRRAAGASKQSSGPTSERKARGRGPYPLGGCKAVNGSSKNDAE